MLARCPSNAVRAPGIIAALSLLLGARGADACTQCEDRLPNDLPFSSERQGRVRAYHGREEPRAQPAASRHEPTSERTRVAFGCCNGWFGSYSTSTKKGHSRNTILAVSATSRQVLSSIVNAMLSS